MLAAMTMTRDERGLLRAQTPVPLPKGIVERAWEEERMQVQNPRIRAFLRCIETLEGARESNYALLHCSPGRINEILGSVREVSLMIRAEVTPLVASTSIIPELENARESIEMYLESIEREVLVPLDRFSARIGEDRLDEVRRLLCVAIGKLHAFLIDSQSQLLAADPRSQHHADYFLSRKFPKDVEEAEWLHSSVLRLAAILEELEKGRESALVRPAAQIGSNRGPVSPSAWGLTESYVAAVRKALLPHLREVLTLKGIRVSEIELVEGQGTHLQSECALALELHSLATRIGGESGSAAAVAVLASRLSEILSSISFRIRDLGAFLPLWERGISQRRALLLKRQLGARVPAGA